jgi:hypothetical protein
VDFAENLAVTERAGTARFEGRMRVGGPAGTGHPRLPQLDGIVDFASRRAIARFQAHQLPVVGRHGVSDVDVTMRYDGAEQVMHSHGESRAYPTRAGLRLREPPALQFLDFLCDGEVATFEPAGGASVRGVDTRHDVVMMLLEQSLWPGRRLRRVRKPRRAEALSVEVWVDDVGRFRRVAWAPAVVRRPRREVWTITELWDFGGPDAIPAADISEPSLGLTEISVEPALTTPN